jgi:hypothetical protein
MKKEGVTKRIISVLRLQRGTKDPKLKESEAHDASHAYSARLAVVRLYQEVDNTISLNITSTADKIICFWSHSTYM